MSPGKGRGQLMYYKNWQIDILDADADEGSLHNEKAVKWYVQRKLFFSDGILESLAMSHGMCPESLFFSKVHSWTKGSDL